MTPELQTAAQNLVDLTLEKQNYEKDKFSLERKIKDNEDELKENQIILKKSVGTNIQQKIIRVENYTVLIRDTSLNENQNKDPKVDISIFNPEGEPLR